MLPTKDRHAPRTSQPHTCCVLCCLFVQSRPAHLHMPSAPYARRCLSSTLRKRVSDIQRKCPCCPLEEPPCCYFMPEQESATPIEDTAMSLSWQVKRCKSSQAAASPCKNKRELWCATGHREIQTTQRDRAFGLALRLLFMSFPHLASHRAAKKAFWFLIQANVRFRLCAWPLD